MIVDKEIKKIKIMRKIGVGKEKIINIEKGMKKGGMVEKKEEEENLRKGKRSNNIGEINWKMKRI